MLYGAELTAVVSEVVEVDAVFVVDAVEGLITPLRVILTVSPGATVLPLKITQVTISPLMVGQFPTVVLPEVVSMIWVLTRLLSPVPDGIVRVIWLPDAPASPPVAEVANVIAYDVFAPTAADGGVIVTDGWVIGFCATVV